MKKLNTNNHLKKNNSLDSATSKPLLTDLNRLIEGAKSRIIYSANSELVLLYWKIGERIQEEILKNTRADYGDRIVATVSQQLTQEYGRGFTKSSISRMVKFYKVFPDREIVATLSQQLTWSHFIELITLKPDLKCNFYTEMCRIERWSVRKLREKIDGMLYERTAIAKKPAEVARLEIENLRKEDVLTPDLVLKDPYLLDFLDLTDAYNEKDLESAILREIEKFILELGSDFSFLSRQKRIVIGEEDYYIDLLFYNRALRRIIAIELKMGRFKAADKGQMELYLRWLDKNEKRAGEESPLGIILCTDKNQEQVELFELAQNGIHIAEFITQLPPQEIFEKKLHKAIEYAKAKLERSIS
ncbi:MAG: PDDEXK nuclease domain-containing protein [Alphaproteobacteria bacterium]|nr:PDDEXK nuclease domain-containing protein [Alphaproteobacteria bacterium]